MKTLLYVLSFSAIFAVSTSNAQSQEKCNFDCTLIKHLTSIQSRNYELLESTITPDKEMTFILPNGQYFEDPLTFKKLIKEWFADTAWTFEYKIIRKFHSNSLGYALLLIDYNEADRNGKPYHLDHYLSLVFQKKGERWYLVHDQNTKTQLKK